MGEQSYHRRVIRRYVEGDVFVWIAIDEVKKHSAETTSHQ